MGTITRGSCVQCLYIYEVCYTWAQLLGEVVCNGNVYTRDISVLECSLSEAFYLKRESVFER